MDTRLLRVNGAAHHLVLRLAIINGTSVAHEIDLLLGANPKHIVARLARTEPTDPTFIYNERAFYH